MPSSAYAYVVYFRSPQLLFSNNFYFIIDFKKTLFIMGDNLKRTMEVIEGLGWKPACFAVQD